MAIFTSADRFTSCLVNPEPGGPIQSLAGLIFARAILQYASIALNQGAEFPLIARSGAWHTFRKQFGSICEPMKSRTLLSSLPFLISTAHA